MPTPKKKTNINDVAKHVGMTSITVSRALNTPEKVKKATLEKILNAAKELNYVPNAIARNLKSQQSRIIGLVTSSIDNPFYTNTFKAVNRVAKANNYSLMLFDTDGSEELEQKAVETLMSYQVSGIILSAVSDSEAYAPSYLAKLEMAHIPVVQIDRQISATSFPGVYLDNFNSGYKGMQQFLKQKFNNVLILAGPETSKITIDRINGIKKAVAECGKNIQLNIQYGDYNKELARDSVQAVITSKQLPDAIFGLNILITIGAMEAIQDAGLNYEQFGLMSIDHIPYARAFGKSIPCVKHDTYELGISAINILMQQIEGVSGTIEDHVIVGELCT